MPQCLQFSPVWLWVISFPFGIAVQNSAFLLAVLGLMPRLFQRSWIQIWAMPASRHLVLMMVFALSFLLSISLATAWNPHNPLNNYFSQLGGYGAWIIAPALVYWAWGDVSLQQLWRKLLLLLVALSILWACVAISQSLWGWRFVGTQLVFEESHFRPRGFYSHPLTFAYAALLFWPAALLWLLHRPRHLRPWLFTIAIAVCLVLTQSRTVQLVALALVAWHMIFALKGRRRLLGLGCGLLVVVLVALTPNRLTERFAQTFSAAGLDRHTERYLDDRLAFWHAHWLMVKERPWLGHGFALNTPYRLPYYEQIGLANFAKPYEAHNMFLQMLANGGLLACLCFMFWSLTFLHLFYRQRQRAWLWPLAWQTLAVFFTASLTQNAFQDASVRMVFVLFCTGLCLAQSHHKQA